MFISRCCLVGGMNYTCHCHYDKRRCNQLHLYGDRLLAVGSRAENHRSLHLNDNNVGAAVRQISNTAGCAAAIFTGFSGMIDSILLPLFTAGQLKRIQHL
ncbi:hypothetical protein [Collimonas arenae]|uniref:hypothetical protein n=1 Tax=Collimonas arenae TaxID=279058 RepID=UPI0012E7D94F|nr:hypothetical protein [Collimonas arenae]